jgi:hypothetical protein
VMRKFGSDRERRRRRSLALYEPEEATKGAVRAVKGDSLTTA